VHAASNQPLAGAAVTLSRAAAVHGIGFDDNPDAQAAGTTVNTGQDGRFVFPNVAAGRYTLVARRDGFISQQSGRRGANSLGAVLVVSNQKIENVVLAMTPTPSIAGFVYGAVGDPQAGVRMEAYRLRYTVNGRRLVRAQIVATNDLGEYRLFGLDAGRYLVGATLSDDGRRSLNGAGWRMSPNVSSPDDGFATFYFSGVTSIGDAQAVTIGPATTAGNISFALKETPRFVIHGEAKRAGGDCPGLDVSFAPLELALSSDAFTSGPVKTGGNCEFWIRGVSPGTYVIRATGRDNERRYFSDGVRAPVTDRDVDNIKVSLNPTIDVVPGLLASEAGRSPVLQNRGVKITLVSPEDPRRNVSALADEGTYPWAFTLHDVAPGDYDLVADLPSGFYINRASLSGREVQFAPLRIDARTVGRLEVQFSSAIASVEGRVSSLGAPIAGAQVVLIPEERYRRRPERYLLAATDSMGQFEIIGIPLGVYTAFAFEEIEPGAYYDPEFVRRFASKGVGVKLDPSGRMTLQLELISAADAGDGH
jgi:hypothetical protein